MNLTTRTLATLAALTLAIVNLSCSFDSSLGDLSCDEEGTHDDGRVCQDGYWVAADGVTQDATDSEDDTQDVIEDIEPDLAEDVQSDTEPDTSPDGGCEEQTWYRDSDGDGFGSDDSNVESCDRPSPDHVQQGGDCDDGDSEIKPGATEVCDEVDNNCDGNVDVGCPCFDGETRSCGPEEGQCEQGVQSCDTAGTWGTCEGGVGPVAETCDNQDNDCDGSVDEELTRNCGTDVGQCDFGTETCNGGSWGTCMGQVEPKDETCDGLDNDCDGSVDEALTRSCGTDTGVCSTGTETCSTGSWGSCQGETTGSTETCDGMDNDCDGSVDEGLTRSCGTDTGVCSTGTETCSSGQWGSCQGETSGSSETCDGQDNDCDGSVDEGVKTTYYLDEDGDGYGTNDSIEACNPSGDYTATQSGDCDDGDEDINPGAEEVCDDVDSNCSNSADPDDPAADSYCGGNQECRQLEGDICCAPSAAGSC